MEDIPHELFFCHTIREYWDKYLSSVKGIDNLLNFIDVALIVKEKGNIEGLATFFLMAWGFWFRRNRMVHKKIYVYPRQVIEHDLSMPKTHKDL